MSLRFCAAVLFSLVATTAHAHPGNHAHMSILEAIQHYAEPDHLAFLALTIIVGILAYRFGRHTEAKAQASIKSSKSERA